MNPPVCESVLLDYLNRLCELDNVALIYPENQYLGHQVKCSVYELAGFFPSSYGSLMLAKRFKHKEKLNHAYMKMREVGIVDRLSKKFEMKKDPVKNFQDHYSDKYNVIDEGVMFDHVKFIVIGYFMFLPIPLVILVIEILVHKYKHRILRIINRLANNLP